MPEKLLAGNGDEQEDDSLAQVNLAYEDPPPGSPQGTPKDLVEKEGEYGVCGCVPYIYRTYNMSHCCICLKKVNM